MGLFRSLFGIYSYLFHGLFALFLLGVAVASITSGANTLQFYVLPWEGTTLAYLMIGLAGLGIFCVLMAMRGALRSLFFLWTLVVLALIVRGFFFTRHTFVPDTDEFATAMWLILAALLACVGARLQSRPARSLQ